MYKNKKISGEELEKVEYEDALSMEAAQNEDYFRYCQMNGIDWKPIRSEVESLRKSVSMLCNTTRSRWEVDTRAMADKALTNSSATKDWAVRELNDLWVKVEHLRTAIRRLSIAAILLGIGQIATSVARIIH